MSAGSIDNDDRFGQLRRPRGGDTLVIDTIMRVLRYLLLIGLALIFLLPFYIMVRNALMTQEEITAFDAW